MQVNVKDIAYKIMNYVDEKSTESEYENVKSHGFEDRLMLHFQKSDDQGAINLVFVMGDEGISISKKFRSSMIMKELFGQLIKYSDPRLFDIIDEQLCEKSLK